MFPICLKGFDDKYGVYGPTTGPENINFGSSKNRLKCIATGPGTLINHFGIIKTIQPNKT